MGSREQCVQVLDLFLFERMGRGDGVESRNWRRRGGLDSAPRRLLGNFVYIQLLPERENLFFISD